MSFCQQSSGVVVFNYANWIARYPEFSGVFSDTAQAYFNEACLYQDNTPCSAVQDLSSRTTFLNMLTAHIAAMNGAGANNQGSSTLVGRISNASQGSESVQAEFSAPTTDMQAWANQTKYGAAWWAATARYRRFRYVPGPRPLGTGFGSSGGPRGYYPGGVW